ncbi:MAG: histidinol-phosphatase HisJ family protein [Muribaculaceae bacterium]|nr:histidinol-phosphatase HisJ family protein [Muribaculaceae bacterium]
MTVGRLKDIISSGEGYNFHTHTPWCDGHSAPREMALAAIAADISHLGFSPHSPVPVPSPCNMAMTDVPAYFDAITRLRDEFYPGLHVYTGMEVDYLHGLYGPASPEIQDLGLDFAIGSVHFIPRRDGRFVDIDGNFDSFTRKMHDDFGGDIVYVVNTFYEASHRMLELGGFEILGHADKVAQNAGLYHPGLEQEGWYRDLADNFLKAVAESGVIVEINTKVRADKGRFFPHERFWPRLVESGVALMVNSDAHYAEKINASRGEALETLQRYA